VGYRDVATNGCHTIKINVNRKQLQYSVTHTASLFIKYERVTSAAQPAVHIHRNSYGKASVTGMAAGGAEPLEEAASAEGDPPCDPEGPESGADAAALAAAASGANHGCASASATLNRRAGSTHSKPLIRSSALSLAIAW
jgi:hypothetical protein